MFALLDVLLVVAAVHKDIFKLILNQLAQVLITFGIA